MIEVKNLSFRYSESEYGVENVNLCIGDGECVVFTGESGCGKTTLTRLINGLAPAYYFGKKTGVISIDGIDISKLPIYEVGRIVGSIFQDPQRQFFSSELAGEVAFACENYGFLREEIVNRTDLSINNMRLNHLRNTSLNMLSGGEKQRVAIASVYALQPRVFVFDEPTANLDSDGVRQLQETLLELKTAGHTLIIAEHRLDWLCEIADRYICMEAGKIKKEYSATDFISMNNEERISLGLRGKTKFSVRSFLSPNQNISTAIMTDGISCTRGKKVIWDHLSFFFNKGNITALTGHNGIGKTTLALALSGLTRVQQGRIFINDRKTSCAGLRKSVYYCSNDTVTQFFTNNVSEELLLNMKHDGKKLSEAKELLKRMRLYSYKDAHPQSLSGGQRQRLAVCCALLSDKDILIFDEPTSGLDGKNMLLIAAELKNAIQKGKSILVITHDEDFISACCNYVLNMDSIQQNNQKNQKGGS